MRRVLRVKRQDIRDNSDITRLKGIRDKDVERMKKYQRAYLRINQMIEEIEQCASVS